MRELNAEEKFELLKQVKFWFSMCERLHKILDDMQDGVDAEFNVIGESCHVPLSLYETVKLCRVRTERLVRAAHKAGIRKGLLAASVPVGWSEHNNGMGIINLILVDGWTLKA